jgi:hypothetical protein
MQAFDVAKRRGAKRLDFLQPYLIALYADAEARGINADALVAQADLETGAFTSTYWTRDGNPAGLAAFDDGSSWGLTFTPQKAARAHVVHMARYLGLEDVPADWVATDARWKAVADAGYVGDVKSTDDLGNGRWATDPQYASKLKQRYAAYFGEYQETPPVADKITFGKVPHPTYHNRPIWKAENKGQNNLGKRSVKGVVYHRILGTLWGTDGYFRNPDVNSLTDYGVGVEAQDGAANDGVILRWNDPYGYQSGWASGTYNGAYGDGAAFVNKYGVNAINRDQVSIEISGFQNTAFSSKAKAAVAALSAYYADQYGIPWDVYPIAPQDGFSFVRWHEEFTRGTGKRCPFDVVKEATPEVIEMTRAILKQYQTGSYEQPETPDISTYASPITYPWLAPEEAAKGEDRVIVNPNSQTDVYFAPNVYTAIQETPRRQATGANRKIVGPPIKKGLKFKADYVYRSGRESWVLTPHGTRVKAAHLLPKVQITASGTVSVYRQPGAKPEIVRRADTTE